MAIQYDWGIDEICDSEETKSLIFSRIKRSRHSFGNSLEDAMQEGMIGVVIGFEKFDKSKGHQFSTYVTYWIDKRIRMLVPQSIFIKIPRNVWTGYLKHKRGTPIEEIKNMEMYGNFADIGKDIEKVEKLIKAERFSLDFIAKDGSSESIGSKLLVEDENKEEISDIKETLRKLLTPENYQAIHSKFFEDKTLEKTGEEMGVSKQRVEQRLKASLLILKKSHKMKGYLECL